MARTIKDFHDDQIISNAMGGRMILLMDSDGDIVLVVENVVHYSNRSLEGMFNWLMRQHSADKSSLPAACKAHAKNLVTITKLRIRSY